MHTPGQSIDEASDANVIHPDPRQRIVLIAYVVFCVMAFVVAVAMLVSSHIADLLLPYYGWEVIGFLYIISLNCFVPPFLERKPLPVHECFNAISGTLWILVCYGIFTSTIGWMGDDFDNPYLTVTVVQTIWTIAVPLIWIVLFRIHRKSTSMQ